MTANVMGWSPSEEGWLKLNVDRAYASTENITACGGLLQNESGNLLFGFMYRLEGGDSLTVKLWSILVGLKMMCDLGFRKIILEFNSTNALELATMEPNMEHLDYVQLHEVHQLL
ncbi:uncharacterized protein LOC129302762 [Prosopis cineraria]|uniref:uncharacterized protein LOC129302762 n=1 Tax=Prosopis cineraria TaxID=364024 RepID=UPI00240F7763|nr:uncharacterized protein LOC129302762 [Prosopis cineraria]